MEMMIYAKKLKAEIMDSCFLPDWAKTLVNRVIDDQPTVDAEPVVHAHWKNITERPGDVVNGWKSMTGNCGDEEEVYSCSACGRLVYADLDSLMYSPVNEIYPYCHCGARMDEDVL